MYIYQYKPGSRSVRQLRQNIPAKVIKHKDSKFLGGPHLTVINWGSSEVSREVMKSRVINSPNSIGLSSNKRSFFSHMAGYKHLPEFTTEKEEAARWIRNGSMAVCRTVLTGHSAKGLVLARSEEQLVDAPLYTKYKKKRKEYRVHVVKHTTDHYGMLVQEKARRLDVPDEQVNWQVRNHDNGFIYKLGQNVPSIIMDVAREVVDKCSLDFGAVDIIYNSNDNMPYVLEVNTAPGIEGRTVEFYTEQFRQMKDE